MRQLDVTSCYVVSGTLSDGSVFLHREFIWPSCDCPAHRRYVKSEMERKAKRMNSQGASVSVQYQELLDDQWQSAVDPNPVF